MPKKRPGNQHNNRHENGIVAPGKRVTKQKSNGQINGGAIGTLATAAVSDPSPSAAHATSLSSDYHVHGQPSDLKENLSMANGPPVKSREGSNGDIEASSTDYEQAIESLHTQANKAIKSAPKTSVKHRDGTLNLPMTIIRSCPLADTLTILIILLSIPSTMLTLINTLFAMLTFMPPTGSLFSLPNTINDIFQGSGGTPSLATIIITDLIGLLVWLVAWSPVQGLAIEYTQAVVAATLGGSKKNKTTGYDSTLLCMAIVTARHLFSRDWMPIRILGFDWRAVLSKIPYITESRPSFISISNDDLFTTNWRGTWGWFRILIALHILIQGLVHVARRWYQKREYFQPTPIGKKSDPEAASNNMMRPGPNPLADASASSTNTPSPAATSKSTLPIVKDTREKATSGKRKRKQAAQVRCQQPLWASFAATKVTIMREVEQTSSLAEFNDTNATDPSDLGNACFNATGDQLWISEVHPDRFAFKTTYSIAYNKHDGSSMSEADTGIDRSKPFYVRVNDTDWTSTKIARCENAMEGQNIWSGIVFGLAPSSSYRCCVVSSEGDSVFSTMTVTTSPSLMEEAGRFNLDELMSRN